MRRSRIGGSVPFRPCVPMGLMRTRPAISPLSLLPPIYTKHTNTGERKDRRRSVNEECRAGHRKRNQIPVRIFCLRVSLENGRIRFVCLDTPELTNRPPTVRSVRHDTLHYIHWLIHCKLFYYGVSKMETHAKIHVE